MTNQRSDSYDDAITSLQTIRAKARAEKINDLTNADLINLVLVARLGSIGSYLGQISTKLENLGNIVRALSELKPK